MVIVAAGLAGPAGAQESTRPREIGAGAIAQAPEMPEGIIKRFSEEERRALSRPEDSHDRIKTYIRLARARLKNARDLLNRDDYTGADEQLQVYAVLVTEAGRFRATSVRPRDKANKTLEQGLREQLRVLEGIRRDTPSMHIEPAEKAFAIANRVRLQSLSALLGDGKILLPESENPF